MPKDNKKSEEYLDDLLKSIIEPQNENSVSSEESDGNLESDDTLESSQNQLELDKLIEFEDSLEFEDEEEDLLGDFNSDDSLEGNVISDIEDLMKSSEESQNELFDSQPNDLLDSLDSIIDEANVPEEEHMEEHMEDEIDHADDLSPNIENMDDDIAALMGLLGEEDVPSDVPSNVSDNASDDMDDVDLDSVNNAILKKEKNGLFSRILSKFTKKKKEEVKEEQEFDEDNIPIRRRSVDMDESEDEQDDSGNQKKKSKKEKKDKKKKKINDTEDEKIKVSFIGLLFMITFISGFVLLLTLFSHSFTYNQKINQATTYFVEKNYQKAYDLLVGVNMKQADQYFYQQIETVMYVEKQYRSYYNFTELGMNAEALDSLVKGVKNYDQYKDRGRDIGVFDEMQGVLDKISDKLNSEFGLTESQARELTMLDDQQRYSFRIQQIVRE